MQTSQQVPRGRTRTTGVRTALTLGLTALLAAAGVAATTASALGASTQQGAAVAAAAAPVRIMPLGDSITGGPGCWRALLWNRLQGAGYTNIDFVGTLPGGGCGLSGWDGDNEGHGGIAATTIADQSLLPGWLSTTTPDIVLMHLGTNDIWGNPATSTVLAAYTTLIGQMRASNPAMKIIVAQIIPMDPPGCAYCAPGVVALNAAIPAWAASLSTAQSPISVVDQWTGFDPVADTLGDGVHPNDSGFQKMSDRWYPALTRLLSSGTSPSTSGSASASTSTSASASASASASRSASAGPSSSPSGSPSAGTSGPACTASYTVTGSWQGGFQGQVTVTSTGTRATTGWSVTWTFGSGQVISQAWGGTATQTGTAVSVVNASWNGALATGTTASVGFIASSTTTNQTPTDVVCRAS